MENQQELLSPQMADHSSIHQCLVLLSFANTKWSCLAWSFLLLREMMWLSWGQWVMERSDSIPLLRQLPDVLCDFTLSLSPVLGWEGVRPRDLEITWLWRHRMRWKEPGSWVPTRRALHDQEHCHWTWWEQEIPLYCVKSLRFGIVSYSNCS